MERGWTRETFAFAMAVQNLTWGVTGLFAGMVADRFGAFRVLVVCGLAYGRDGADGTREHAMGLLASAGVLVGIAQAGTTTPWSTA